jgi:hypothetical protein
MDMIVWGSHSDKDKLIFFCKASGQVGFFRGDKAAGT